MLLTVLVAAQQVLAEGVKKVVVVTDDGLAELRLTGAPGSETLTMEPLFRERRIALAVQPTPTGTVVDIDPTQVGRALRNVLANAAQHSPAGATVGVQVELLRTEAVVRVTDEGPGISDEDLPHVFERFYRADRARATEEPRTGSGIGLTIARELLVANGGQIGVERTSPGGTVFAITLPRATRQQPD